ncbi:MAG: arylamine N-acetyltransferase [Desulfobacula sp.]|jgi:N-hydroxyarylamine O-acetyltransferase|uniref:arylamine N-acetyltransferase family protein n=1 Tax=Desulfobacula sp. TaxID=2593537 RepID=UPI001E06CE7E|nr:arylamine N-acetyltransferase [Desulfobacula sp.]MBT4024279.1 arylamine N-acetyltransferase [Desulfobacula sp.]MBT4873788.1 arylamine N-acetyltransferase [Desulfobacula sp.]MBT5543432.1 arylamine N-acetyltransferase [Desulfobacula sp.]MBT5973005.1 arylamine N-acetyltransferase [Desulfobacula sp.]
MKSFEFDLEAYFNRIDYRGETDVSLNTLTRLHQANFHTIPFENFDILLGRGIDLDPQAVFNKLVLKKRGGNCFELNGLFLHAIQTLGFKARALLARVHLTGTPSGRGHQLELVSIDGKDWVVDVGFGMNSPCKPILLELDEPFTENGRTIRLTDGGHFGIMFQALENDEWKDLYSFDLGYVLPPDIAYGNHYTSTHPEAFFTKSRVAGISFPGGGKFLMDRTLKITTNGKEDVQILSDSPAYLDALKKYFGIELDASYDDLKPMPPEE